MNDVESEKLCEILVSDLGVVTVALRPGLPFEPEGYRTTDPGAELEVFGEGRKLRLPIEEEKRESVKEVKDIYLEEYGPTDTEPCRSWMLAREVGKDS